MSTDPRMIEIAKTTNNLNQNKIKFNSTEKEDEDILKNANQKEPVIIYNCLSQIYLRIIRKINLLFFICLSIVYHGFQVEYFRAWYQWETLRIIEIVLLFLLIVDIVTIQILILRLRGKVLTLLIAIGFSIICVQIGLKIADPVDNKKSSEKTVNILRIFIALFSIYILDEKELIKLSNLYSKSKRKHSYSIHNEKDNKSLDKNQNPDYNAVINPKITNNLKNHSNSKRGSFGRLDVRPSNEINEIKIIDELMAAIKLKTDHEVSDKNEIKLNLNVKTFTRIIRDNLDNILFHTFDIFDFDTDCLGNSIFLLMNYYYKIYNWEAIKIGETQFMNLIYNIEKNYNQNNPYHNSIHAADVTNTTYFILEALDVCKLCGLTSLEILILLISCATHDIDHPGNTNSFEINSRSLLSLTYNDKSVLENYHLFLFFNFLINNSMNIFSNFELNELKLIRKQFINNIISTDMTNHKNDFNKLQELVASNNFDPQKQENKEFIITQLIHFSDISNGTKPFNLYEKWVNILFIEFFAQGDKEKEMGLPISMMCDREKTKIPDSQIFFIDFITLGLTKTLMIAFPKFEIFVNTLEENKKIWESKKNQPYELDEDR